MLPLCWQLHSFAEITAPSCPRFWRFLGSSSAMCGIPAVPGFCSQADLEELCPLNFQARNGCSECAKGKPKWHWAGRDVPASATHEHHCYWFYRHKPWTISRMELAGTKEKIPMCVHKQFMVLDLREVSQMLKGCLYWSSFPCFVINQPIQFVSVNIQQDPGLWFLPFQLAALTSILEHLRHG